MSKRGAYSPEELATLGRLVRAANLTYSAERPAQAAASRCVAACTASRTTSFPPAQPTCSPAPPCDWNHDKVA